MQVKDRVFIVTGASSAIGLSTAIALSDRGAKVALLARSSDALQELARKLPGSLRRSLSGRTSPGLVENRMMIGYWLPA
jgi:NADP-dependent 3-hydroxy acid dehydrogenase YdfG